MPFVDPCGGLLIADEPTAALDATTQARILKLIRQIRDEFQMAVVMTTHDLGVIAAMCEVVVAARYRGQIVEFGSTEAVFYRHFHPYTEGLLRSTPVISRERVKRKPIAGNVPHDPVRKWRPPCTAPCAVFLVFHITE